jgi:hypothetical protein
MGARQRWDALSAAEGRRHPGEGAAAALNGPSFNKRLSADAAFCGIC